MGKKLGILTVNSISHALVDAACAALVISTARYGNSLIEPVSVILIYNLLAFATQPIFGLMTDKFFNSSRVAAFGCIAIAGSLFLNNIPVLAVFIAGIGNALFHVGGGITCLEIDPGKAWAPGIFVAPGNIGLLIGTLLGKQGYTSWHFIILLVLASCAIISIGKPEIEESSDISSSNITSIRIENYSKSILIALGLILVTVVFRSFVGLSIKYDWKENLDLVIIMSIFVSLGKALGGILADKFGLFKISVSGLLLSVPCLSLGFTYPALGIIGLLLFNLSMPITLIAVVNMFPRYKGFAFGLTVIALSLGSIPAFADIKLTDSIGISIFTLVSAIALSIGLCMYNKTDSKKDLGVDM